jgi:hypothetical protein
VAEWFKATDCKSVGGFLRRFESCLSQYQPIFGSSKETGIGSHSLVMLPIQGPLQRKSAKGVGHCLLEAFSIRFISFFLF